MRLGVALPERVLEARQDAQAVVSSVRLNSEQRGAPLDRADVGRPCVNARLQRMTIARQAGSSPACHWIYFEDWHGSPLEGITTRPKIRHLIKQLQESGSIQ